jgi:Kinase binding protein CGI-121
MKIDAHLNSSIQTTTTTGSGAVDVPFTNSSLSQIRDLEKIRRAYRIGDRKGAGGGAGGGEGAGSARGKGEQKEEKEMEMEEEVKRLERAVLGAMALRGAT